MKQVDFFKLERSVQDRFLSACRGEFDPKPILFRRSVRPTAWFWLALVPLAIGGMLGLFYTGMGDLQSDLARQPAAFTAAYVGLAIAFAVGIVQFLAVRAASRGLPFTPGFYLFPACLVDARGTTLFVTEITELASAKPDAGHVVVEIGGATHRFPVEAGFSDQALSAIKLAQMQCSDDLEAAAMVMLDPLAPPVVVGPFAPEKALVERRPLWVKIRFVAAAAFGVVGVIVFQQRDALSDEAMYQTAKQRDDIATYKRYLERGTDHTTVVKRVMLPRAELRIAVADGSVESIDAFKAAYPDTDIGPEVEEARKRALEQAFNTAAKPATLDALLAFEEKYPDHHLGKHMTAHRHAIYMRALEGYKAKMPQGGKTRDFAAKLVAYSEKLGPVKTPKGLRGAEVAVRIRAVPSKALAKADEVVKKNQYYGGKRSLPTRYLDREALAALEKSSVADYASALAAGFDETVLRFVAAEEADGSADLPAVDKPTLVISYRIEPSGRNYVAAKPRGVYIGLVFFYRVDFLLPGDEKAHTFKHVLPVKVPGAIVAKHAKKQDFKLEPALYEEMTKKAFADLHRRYIALWLAKP